MLICEVTFPDDTGDHGAVWAEVKGDRGVSVAEVPAVVATAAAAMGAAAMAAAMVEVRAATAALALSYSIRLSALLQWAVRQFIDSEANMTAVERILEYTRLPPEGFPHPDEPPSGWIWKGALSFDNVTVRYGSHSVLKSLSFDIKPGERIGIVGKGLFSFFLMYSSLNVYRSHWRRKIEPCVGSLPARGMLRRHNSH